jgi:hypothetical protein
MKTIDVRLPDGQMQPLTYPDDWSDEQLQTAIHSQFKEYSAPNETSPNVESEEMPSSLTSIPGHDPLSQALKDQMYRTIGLRNKDSETTGIKGVKNDLWDALKGVIGSMSNIPGEVGDIFSQVREHPLKAAGHNIGQLAAGIGELGKGTVNLPSKLVQYLGEKELPAGGLIAQSLKDVGKTLQPLPDDTGVEKFLGLEASEKGDPLVRAIPQLATVLGGAKQLLKSPLKQEMKGLEKQIEQAGEQLNLTKEQTKALQEHLREQFAKEHRIRMGESSPSGQRVEQYLKEGKVEEMKPMGLKEGKEVPEGTPTEIVESAKKNFDEAQTKLSEALNINKDQALEGGTTARQLIMEDKSKADKLYKDVREHYNQSDVKVDNGKEIARIKEALEAIKDADELAPGYGSDTPVEKVLSQHIKALESETVPARDLFDTARTLEKRASDIRKKQYSGVSDLEFKQLGELADKYSNEAKKINKTLEQTGDEGVRNQLKEANRLWADYSSLKKHPAGRSILYDSKLPRNYMNSITGTRPGSDYLRRITEGSATIKRNALGMTHAKPGKHKELLNPNEMVQSYIQDLPEVENAISNLAEKQESHGQAKQLAESMKTQAQINKLQEEIKSHQKAEKELDKQIAKEKAQGNDIEALSKRRDELREKIENKNTKVKKVKDAVLKLSGIKYLSHKVGF